MQTVTMTHPDLPDPIQVPESAVPIHMASGWVTERKPADALGSAAAATGPVSDETVPPAGADALAAAAGTETTTARKRS